MQRDSLIEVLKVDFTGVTYHMVLWILLQSADFYRNSQHKVTEMSNPGNVLYISSSLWSI